MVLAVLPTRQPIALNRDAEMYDRHFMHMEESMTDGCFSAQEMTSTGDTLWRGQTFTG